MATASIPTVLCLFAIFAIINFVPTPSADDTKTGSLYFPSANLKKLPNPPISFNTPGLKDFLIRGFILFLKTPELFISTPDFWYVICIFQSLTDRNSALQAKTYRVSFLL